VIKSGKVQGHALRLQGDQISPEERELIRSLIDSSYQQFVRDVAAGRNLPIDDIAPQADGRVFGGDAALRYSS
jgi:protease-4